MMSTLEPNNTRLIQQSKQLTSGKMTLEDNVVDCWYYLNSIKVIIKFFKTRKRNNNINPTLKSSCDHFHAKLVLKFNKIILENCKHPF